MSEKLKAGVVGLRMGKNHVRALSTEGRVEIGALCDIDRTVAEAIVEELELSPRPAIYTDFAAMVKSEALDIVTVAAPNRFHAEMTIAAANAGAKAICCEKPIAVDLGEARRMVEVCARKGTRLIVNHQRRLGADFVWMRQQIEAGSIGDVYLIRGTCAGDMLSDGTHLIDSSLFISGDVDWKWVFASSHRDSYEVSGDGMSQTTGGGFDKTGGWRFGHPVEDGMFAVVELANGVRVEFLTGDLRVPGRPYHDIEVLGTKGSLWRAGDKNDENLFRRGPGYAWEPVRDVPRQPTSDRIALSYARLVDILLRDGSDREHPLGTPFTMRGFELLMGIYESARTRSVIQPPVTQERYPLAVELGLS